MKRIDPTILKETAFVLAMSLVFSVLMQGVFLLCGVWDFSVLLGNLLGVCATVFNFFWLGLSVQKALGKEENEAKRLIRQSQSARLFCLLLVALVAYLTPAFHLLATAIPFLFARIALLIRPLFPMDN